MSVSGFWFFSKQNQRRQALPLQEDEAGGPWGLGRGTCPALTHGTPSTNSQMHLTFRSWAGAARPSVQVAP